MKDGWELFNPTLFQSRLGSHGDNEAGGDSNSDSEGSNTDSDGVTGGLYLSPCC